MHDHHDFMRYRGSTPPDPDLVAWVWENFDFDALAKVCEMDEAGFEDEYGLTKHQVHDAPEYANWFLHRSAASTGETASPILAVAHLDTVGLAHQRRCQFLETEDGWVVYSRALDDRLGAYIILELLPKMGLHFDVLLTIGEETGNSTAQWFDATGHDYNWGIEFDRGGTDVVMYQYEDSATVALVEATGARVEDGIFSDISYLEHLGVKMFNWGVGYRDYHGPRAHAWLDDTVKMVAYFLDFHAENKDTVLPHVQRSSALWGGDLPDEELCEVDDDDCNGEVSDTSYGVLCEFHENMLVAQ